MTGQVYLLGLSFLLCRIAWSSVYVLSSGALYEGIYYFTLSTGPCNRYCFYVLFLNDEATWGLVRFSNLFREYTRFWTLGTPEMMVLSAALQILVQAGNQKCYYICIYEHLHLDVILEQEKNEIASVWYSWPLSNGFQLSGPLILGLFK